jgi:TRAP-type C4-dicarboxylate transport system substrate-binding protein
MRATHLAAGALVAGALAGPAPAATPIHIGTVAPRDTPWVDVLTQMRQDWTRISGGEVDLKIHAGGALGDELELVNKMRINQLQAVAMSGVGLSHVEPGAACVQIPMMFDSYAELDYVRERIAPDLERRLRDRGYVVLNWGDAGWIHFFTKRPARTPDEIRGMKLFIAAGDAETLELYQAAGLQPVPLALTDMTSALTTGMIDAFDVPPLLAMVNQWFPLARNMIDVKWAPLVGATIIRADAWERLPADRRPALLEAGRAAGEKLRAEIRRLGDDAIEAMRERDLNVVHVDGATLEIWRREAVAVYPRLRGEIIPADLFDRVQALRDEYRAAQPPPQPRAPEPPGPAPPAPATSGGNR